MKIFFDTEFTGLHKNTTLISIGLYASNGLAFYGELTDFDESQVNDWIRENVIKNLRGGVAGTVEDCGETFCVGNRKFVADELRAWFGHVAGVAMKGNCDMWSDCLAYDWVLFCDLFGD